MRLSFTDCLGEKIISLPQMWQWFPEVRDFSVPLSAFPFDPTLIPLGLLPDAVAHCEGGYTVELFGASWSVESWVKS